MREFTGLSAVEILEKIIRAPSAWKNRTYIIAGRSGPTGKTWLCQQLKTRGFVAIEISEDVWDIVDYKSDKNHFRFAGDYAVIVLNEILPQFKDRFGKG